MVLLLLALAVGVFLWQNPDRQPDWLQAWVPDASDVQIIMYRWQDADGEWHISDTPPATGDYETVRVSRDANVVPRRGADEDG